MKTNHNKWIACTGIVLAALSLVAWTNAGSTFPVKYRITCTADTTPHKTYHFKHEYNSEDLDKAMKELDIALSNINVDLKMDLSGINTEIKKALKEVNSEKINAEIKAALKNTDWSQVHTDISNAMEEVKLNLKEINSQEIQKEIAAAMESVRMVEPHVHINMDGLKETIDKSLDGAREGISKAKRELNNLKEFTEALENDKLISKKKGYKVEVKKGELYINGAKQSKEVNDKYKKYFHEDSNFTLKNDGAEIENL